MTSDLSSALEVLDDDALYKSTYTLLYFTFFTVLGLDGIDIVLYSKREL